jgi:membrane protease YdiL (CAAX protease family)
MSGLSMRFFIKSLFAIMAAVIVAGLLTYPVWLIVTQFADYRPDRVMRRIGTLLLAIALVWILRREGLADRTTFGYGIARSKFLKQMAGGYVVGLVLMIPLVATFLLLHVRTWNGGLLTMEFAKYLLEGTAIGFAVSFVEETFLRGAMYSVIERESGLVYAIVLPSLLFAAVHFMVDADQMGTVSEVMNFQVGLRIAALAFVDFTAPLRIIDALAALFALGVLLSLLRRRTGAIAASIGVHAGGVAAITVIGELSATNSQAPAWLVGSYNHQVIGWVAFGWISAVALAYWVMRIRSESVTRFAI